MLNQAYEPMKIDLQMFADPVDDGSDLFFDAEQTSEEEESIEESQEQPKGEGEDEPGDAEENAPKAEQEADKATAEAAKGGKIRIKYNGEEKEITLEEAATLAQKGMNYDKVLAERDNLRSSGERAQIDAAAKAAGMSTEVFLSFVREQNKANTLNNALAEVRAKHGDLPDDVAQELAEKVIADNQRAALEAEQAAKNKAEAEKNKVWVDFVKRYPKFDDVSKFPQSVLDDISGGASPTEAMQRFELEEQKKEIARLEAERETANKNKENKQKSAGSAASSGAQDAPDAFILGFLGD